MGEPTLDKIEDYKELKGEKKKVVWIVIIGLVALGIVYAYMKNSYSKVNDEIIVNEKINRVPVK